MKRLIFCALFVLLAARTACADTVLVKMSVGATVVANCVVSSQLNLDFGTYNPARQGNAPLDVAGSVLSIQCTKGSSGVSIALDNGQSYAESHRNLRGDKNDYIGYEIYTAADHATVWNATQTVGYVPTSGQASSITMYGRVLPQPKAPRPGRYVDTLLAMVNF